MDNLIFFLKNGLNDAFIGEFSTHTHRSHHKMHDILKSSRSLLISIDKNIEALNDETEKILM